MITRRSLTLLAILVALCAPAAAQASAKPGRVVPKVIIVLTDGNSNTGKVSSTLQTTFAPPNGVAAATACKGKIKFSVPIGKKTVKKKHRTIYSVKSASLSNVAGTCTAVATLKLPAALYGKTLKFTASFKGSTAVKKFTKSAKLLVLAPTPPAPTVTLTPGSWTVVQTGTGGAPPLEWSFTVAAGGSVASVQRLTPLPLTCAGGSVSFNLNADLDPFDTPFSTGPVDIAPSDTDTSNGQNALQQFNLHFDSGSHGTGTYRMTGTVYGPSGSLVSYTLFPGCDSGPISVEIKPGTFA